MKGRDKITDLKNSISIYDNLCDGFANNGLTNSYVLTTHLGVGVSDDTLDNPGSDVLSQINAFDRAEIHGTNIGQINMIIVSSFCGPSGLIWGYDIAKSEELYRDYPNNVEYVESHTKEKIPVYSIMPLLTSTRALFGTVEKKKFPIIPGAHVPCAGKNMKMRGPGHIYAALAIGIAKDRESDACLLMEDMGEIKLDFNLPPRLQHEELELRKEEIIKKISNSITVIGDNQKIKYKEIFAGMVDLRINSSQMGCALVAAPYITLARNAIPAGDINSLFTMSLSEWKKRVR